MATLARSFLSQQTKSHIFALSRLRGYPRSYVSDSSNKHTHRNPEVEIFSGPSRRRSAFVRQYASSPADPRVETFSDPARLQPYYTKHPPARDLPRPKKKWPYLLLGAVLGVAGWAAFLTYVTNQEMISSSVVRQIMRCVREDSQLREILGEAIRPQPEWWLNGDPRINGRISTLQGNIDVSLRIRGTKGSGTLYFTSIRKEKGQPFTILRFKVICDDGTVVLIDAEPV